MFEIRMKQLRKNAKLTQKQLAKSIGVVSSTISLYETGKRQPDYVILNKIANHFNVSIDYLLGRVDDPQHNIVPKELISEELARYVDYIGILKDADMAEITPEELREVIEFAKKIQKRKI